MTTMQPLSANTDCVTVLRMFGLNHAPGVQAMLRKVSPLVFRVAKQVRRAFFTIAAFQEFVIDLEPDKGSAFALFAHSNYHAHAFDSTP